VETYDAATCENNLVAEECVACMDNVAETVWQPCGHCTLCAKCMEQLLNTQITNCPLCKGRPTSIASISRKDELNGAILRKNEYEVSSCLSIRHF
jgi:hypothetical protein